MSNSAINLPPDQLAAFCKRHDIARLSLFGSAIRDDFDEASDIDILIEFMPHAKPSLLDLGGMQQELCDILRRQVDLKTPEFLSPFIRERVLQEAKLQYVA